ncbi:MAG: DNA double-strand break repair nuclease NurA [Anaerolineales bacterium]|nr:DNA double-strand break repair nuclease NurA [Anaerolineales bacterium]
MALELNRLTHEVTALGLNLAERLTQLAERLPGAQGSLRAIGVVDDALQRKVAAALPFRWAGAIPTAEAVDAAFPAPPAPARYNAIAADGSQIYPDRHGVALYYLINIGSIVFRSGLAQAPSQASRPQVFYEDADLYEEDGGQKPAVLIDAERDWRELAELARLAQAEAQAAPSVAVLDNGLLLYLSLQIDDQALIRELFSRYLDQLDLLRASGAAVAGVVDRPRAASVVRLLHLNGLAQSEIREDALRDLGPNYAGLTDSLIFGFLRPGERSALFVNASPNNDIYYRPRDHTIYFFYLNAGRPGKDALLRVEVPEWVAVDPARLNLVHAALVAQSRVSDGFPYILVRAHELAVVSVAERRAFDEMIMGALIRQRLSPAISRKAQGKAWTGGGRRRFGG